jgi:hypothetical protein
MEIGKSLFVENVKVLAKKNVIYVKGMDLTLTMTTKYVMNAMVTVE